ncbi:unnamed protein product [Adineta ricciae]|uniref:Uncharacterized protein n=1 Tax=Adineta ricciae TaxID=249248 RepID=A0A814HQR0_ADIRI|nr:unnamed protein product [Adineta ricciae]CAF1287378.1 unnamed protein product [Adineta ricciae]
MSTIFQNNDTILNDRKALGPPSYRLQKIFKERSFTEKLLFPSNTVIPFSALDSNRVVAVPLSFFIDDDARKTAALAARADYPKNEDTHLFIDATGETTTTDSILACLKNLKRRGTAMFV